MFITCAFSVENLPSNQTLGAIAVSSGVDVYGLIGQHFYHLVCSNTACKWNKMQQQLDRAFRYAVMMILPEEYSC